jgi:hypothetical protein
MLNKVFLGSRFFRILWFFVSVCALDGFAATIPTLFNTGVNNDRTLLGPGEVDPHYTLTVSADEGFPGPEAFTLLPGFPVGPWVPEGPASRWIAPQASQATGNAPGTYTFTTTFDLTGFDPATAQITGRISADNSIGAARLNGTVLNGITSPGFNVWTDFTIPVGSPFVAGTNVLEFDTVNAGDTANPIGFRVEMNGRATGANEVPSIVGQPQSQEVIVGDTVTFTVDAAGTPPLSYFWRFKGTPIPGANSQSFTLTGVTTNRAGAYSVIVSNALGQVTSDAANLTVLEPFPGIYDTGVNDARVVLGDSEVDPHYVLTRNADDPSSSNVLTQIDIPSPPWLANSTKSRWVGPFANPTAGGGDYTYRLLLDLTGYDPSTAYLAGSWATDDAGSLFLNGADTGFRSPGFNAFSTFAIRTGFVTGTNVLEFRLNNGGPNPTGLRVENLRGTAQRGGVGQLPPRIVTQPRSSTNVMTTGLTLTAVPDGTQPISFQWLRNGVELAGQTSSTLSIASLRGSDAGTYTVRVSNALGSTNSDPAVVTVIQPQLGVFNTGVDVNGLPLENGQTDPHYVLIAAPEGFGPTAYAPSSAPIPPWVANDENSRWIAPRSDATEVPPGSYRYRLIFTIDNAAEVATAAITANVGTDDGNGGVFLNGQAVDFGASGFGNLTPLDIPQGAPFVHGINTLDFIPVNGGAAANPSGLRVDDIELTGVTVVQSPSLSISRAGNQVRVVWPTSATGFVLQESSNLPGGWANSTAPVTVDGNQNVALVNPTGARKFFRVAKP